MYQMLKYFFILSFSFFFSFCVFYLSHPESIFILKSKFPIVIVGLLPSLLFKKSLFVSHILNVCPGSCYISCYIPLVYYISLFYFSQSFVIFLSFYMTNVLLWLLYFLFFHCLLFQPLKIVSYLLLLVTL